MSLFYLLAVILIASAIFTITQKSPVYSVVGLLVNFLALAALYFTLNAEFLGVIQIVIYSGAILMLFVFVIALLSSGVGPFRAGPNRLPRIAAPALLTTLVAFGFLIFGIAQRPFGPLPPHRPTSFLGNVGDPNVFGSVGDFGVALFTVQLLPFEVTAFILMVAVIGVVLIAGDAVPQPTLGRHRPQKRAAEREPILKAPAP
ncbi:MAG: NADH-quinone oxidoreductase subunit J [Candidatus Eremiobacteraeota bacterium]|nr:NADH-quinone oxidoreductase subunit J [Candidatus Eremiobacteraeota bacterium]MBC5801470.1 NADH-quinone oxidoreductase subunit J [Candidatus Eremiobacteraeota bacterium]MBC5822869.1 NADH-quinone oxidoreductase subunit J [Candidatus Eremiobacteraeota bacterium]